jgi:hypothetical protein
LDTFGGGIANRSTANILNSTLSGNISQGGEGGGIDNGGTLTLNLSTVSGNQGIGIENDNALTISSSTISENSGNYAGGILNIPGSSGPLTISNSTISGNSATGFAGGIADEFFGCFGGPVNLLNSTIAGNTISHGGDSAAQIRASCTTNFHIRNTILAGDGRQSNVRGSLLSDGYNLNSDATGNLRGPGDLTNTDPMLDPNGLQGNGGPTPTIALLPGSPALNAGDPAQLGVADQRGVARSGGVNIGAYQASGSSFVLSAPDTVAAGLAFDLTVAAVDSFGQPAFGYTGTVTFSTSDPDPGVVLPADYTFTSDDQGSVTFSGGVILNTPGDQTICTTDTADGTVTGEALVTVDNGNGPGIAGHHERSRSVPRDLFVSRDMQPLFDRAALPPANMGWVWPSRKLDGARVAEVEILDLG